MNTTLQRFWSAFGVAVATAVFSAHGSLATSAAFVDGLLPALLAVGGLSVLGTFAALGTPRPAGGRARATLVLETAPGTGLAA